MTPQPNPLTPEQLKALTEVLHTMQEQLSQAHERRDSAREELRSLDYEVRSLEADVRAITKVVVNGRPPEAEKVLPLRVRQAGEERSAAVLRGMPKVHAIETVLADAGGRPLHRSEVCAALRQRGFPDESLADTSAGLAYLKRSGRVVNPSRGYWQLAHVTSSTG